MLRIFRNEVSRSGSRGVEDADPILTGPARRAKAQVWNPRIVQATLRTCPARALHRSGRGRHQKKRRSASPWPPRTRKASCPRWGFHTSRKARWWRRSLLIFSKRAPQSWHLYSKIGMGVSPLAIYRMLADNSTGGAGAFFKGRVDAPMKLGLDTMPLNCLQCPPATLILGFIIH